MTDRIDRDRSDDMTDDDRRELGELIAVTGRMRSDFRHVVPDELRAEIDAVEEQARGLEPQVIALARRAFRAMARLRVTLDRGDLPADPQVREVVAGILESDTSQNMLSMLWWLRWQLELVEKPEQQSANDAPEWLIDEQLNAMLLEG